MRETISSTKYFRAFAVLPGSDAVELTIIDLRWGLTDEQVQLGRAVRECLSEVETCLPYFIGLLGDRYGWVPDAGEWLNDPECAPPRPTNSGGGSVADAASPIWKSSTV